jgi:4-alpha-glucanotransferase
VCAERVRYAAQFYHVYRIDHIVGFYRLWHIPQGQPPTKGMLPGCLSSFLSVLFPVSLSICVAHCMLAGFFFPYDQAEWVPLGERLLRVLLEAAPTMLPIGARLRERTKEIERSEQRDNRRNRELSREQACLLEVVVSQVG